MPGTSTTSFADTNEEYEIVKARLNPALYNSVPGIYWANSYLYCVNRKYARLSKYKLFFSREISPDIVSWGYGSDDSDINGQLSRYAIGSTDFEGLGFDPAMITTADRYNFVDPTVEGSLMYMVPNSPGVNYTIDEYGMPQVYAEVEWARASSTLLTNQNGISVIKVSYFADEAVRDPGSSSHKKYIKLVYNTPEPNVVDYRGNDGVITTRGTDDNIAIAYDTSTGEVDKLKELYGTPTTNYNEYPTEKYNDVIQQISNQLYLNSTTRERKIFLRDSQPNSLNFKDFLKSTKYTEFNTNLLSMVTTRAITGTASITSTSSGGSYA